MYIKLGKTRINYLTPSTNDNIILSEVIRSSIQYQYPVYVRNLDELNIWFGQDFKEYAYFSKLLNMNATLYLTGPLQDKRLIDKEAGDVDWYDWETKYVDKLPSIGLPEKKYIINGTSDIYIWYEIDENTHTFINVLDLPQELQSFKSQSLENRDTLVIWEDGIYASPSYGNISLPAGYIEGVDLEDLDSDDLKSEKICLVFKFSEDTEKPNRYIVFNDKCYYWGSKPELKGEYTYIATSKSLSGVLSEDEGFVVSGSKAYSKSIRTVNYFTCNITFTPSYTDSSNVVYEKFKNDPHVEFTSKTLGTDELNPIEISFNSDSDELNISRFGYSEYYFPQDGIDFYDDITNRSKLVNCEVIGDFEWSSGDWSMSGAVNENIESLNRSLEILTDNDVQADFLFIDSYEDYKENPDETKVKDLLSGVIEKWPNSQILVQNSASDFEFNFVEENNKILYFFNSLQLEGDYMPGWCIFLDGLLTNSFDFKNSTLIYPDIIQDKINAWIYEGYKLEIRNFIEKWYVKDGKPDISYNIEADERKQDLESYKSNYLTSADYYNFYEKLFDGAQYNTSGLMRFVIDKVNREINKNFEGFIGERNYSKLRDLLTTVLRKVAVGYRIINSINVNDFKIDNRHNSLKITVQIEISDLEKNNIITDIELNYSK